MYIHLKILSTYQQCQIPALNLLLKNYLLYMLCGGELRGFFFAHIQS